MEDQHRISPQFLMESFSPVECETGSPISDDPFSLSSLLNLDNYAELCSPSAAGPTFSPFSCPSSPFNYSNLQQVPGNWASLQSPCAMDSSDSTQKTTFQSGTSDNPGCFGSTSAEVCDERMTAIVPRSIPGTLLAEKMLRALSLFKESSGGGILAQVWMPIKSGNGYVLSTSEQPFLLDQILSGYREVSRAFTFSAEEVPGLLPGLPGRVFISGLPEWTSDVVYYNRFEYLRADYAVRHEVRGSLAVPIFEPQGSSCRAVLELVTKREKPDFDVEMENVCSALQAVELTTTKAGAHQQSLTKNQMSALAEILDVVRACCHAHVLPLALTWVPLSYEDHIIDQSISNRVQDVNSSLRKKSLLCIQESACFVNDLQMNGFLHACAEHCLEKGQGIAGKALQSNHPFFSPDVRGYDIREYPLAHHARKYGLHAAVAIRLRSTFTGTDDYILEFFLPVNCKGSSEQQELLNNLSNTMQGICISLRTVSDAEVVGANITKVGCHKQEGIGPPSPNISVKHSQQIDNCSELTASAPFDDSNMVSDEREDSYQEQLKSSSMRHQEKKRNTAEKNIGLSVLQQYFSGSLKDAAKSIGVCPTTLKRICRQHGISRWPSRKINKVNRSLKKIQTVINSVQGVEGALRYDPTSGCLVATVSPEKSMTMSLDSGDREVKSISSVPQIEAHPFVGKLELDDGSIGSQHMQTSSQFTLKHEKDKVCFPQHDWIKESKSASFEKDLSLQANIEDSPTGPINSRDSSHGLNAAKDRDYRGITDKCGLSLEDFECQITSRSSDSQLDLLREHHHPSSSGMTDSSSGSASSCPTLQNSSKSKELTANHGATMTVKATYKEDTVRFKFSPSMGCHQLFEEVGNRFRLPVGTFQLKYMDDEEEWVMLVCDSDLHECMEVLDSVGSHNLKLLVRDMPCVVGSSGGSNFLSADA